MIYEIWIEENDGVEITLTTQNNMSVKKLLRSSAKLVKTFEANFWEEALKIKENIMGL